MLFALIGKYCFLAWESAGCPAHSRRCFAAADGHRHGVCTQLWRHLYNDAEEEEARAKQDISVFPLATPLIAGPGAMGAAILIMADTDGDLVLKAIVIGSILLVLFATLVMLCCQVRYTG